MSDILRDGSSPFSGAYLLYVFNLLQNSFLIILFLEGSVPNTRISSTRQSSRAASSRGSPGAAPASWQSRGGDNEAPAPPFQQRAGVSVRREHVHPTGPAARRARLLAFHRLRMVASCLMRCMSETVFHSPVSHPMVCLPPDEFYGREPPI